jgi:mannose-6-phosphate isomerase
MKVCIIANLMMQNSGKISKLEGVVRHYAWGGFEFIPQLLHVSNPDRKPFAEYWMGAHNDSPSLVHFNGSGPVALNKLIQSDPERLLGERVKKSFGRLPYLFKVQDVKEILSIQVHPNKKSAEKEFEAENNLNIPIDAPNRNYKDDNHKPELMLALSDFYLLHGLKNPEAMRDTLQHTPELRSLLTIFDQSGYKSLYALVMGMTQEEVNSMLQPLIDRIIPLYNAGRLSKDEEDFWAARAALTYNKPGVIDRGIFSIYLLNVVRLKPGQAIFQAEGVLHAYMEGKNMEIMANSDNVLRGGLTPKHVDVPELMKHVRFEAVNPEIIRGVPIEENGEEIFPSPAADFELRRLQLSTGDEVSVKTMTADIFFVLDGNVEAECNGEKIDLKGGESLFAAASSDIQFKAKLDSMLFHATVPFPQS